MERKVKIIFNIIYSIGIICVLTFGAIAIWGPEELQNPNAMVSIRFSALMWLIAGTVPMLAACIAVYTFNNIKSTKYNVINSILIFLPGFICFGCFLFLMLGSKIISLFT